MYGKFLLVALVCVSVAQVRGGELEDAIKKGLANVQNLYQVGREKMSESLDQVNYNNRVIEVKIGESKESADRVRNSSALNLRKVAAAIEQKAKENNSPESVFECIRKNEGDANKQIDTLTKKFKSNFENLGRTCMDNMSTLMKSFGRLESTFKETYEKALKDIKKCKNQGCVYNVVNGFATFFNSSCSSAKRLERQSATIITNLKRDIDLYMESLHRQVNQITFAATKAIENCYNESDKDFEDFPEF